MKYIDKNESPKSIRRIENQNSEIVSEEMKMQSVALSTKSRKQMMR